MNIQRLNELIEEQQMAIDFHKPLDNPDWNQERVRERIEFHSEQLEILKLARMALSFKPFGSNGCKRCEFGSVVLYSHTERCIECAPEDYSRKATKE